MSTKNFLPLDEVKNVVPINKSGTMSVIIPTTGRVMSVKLRARRGGALATLNQLRLAIGDIRLILGTTTVSTLSAGQLL
ncbi:MAG TPA: hypothetical protein VL357_12800, partial [Rariglobus sp.]|nr:hypothetical protein [Rariglobus sp.]